MHMKASFLIGHLLGAALLIPFAPGDARASLLLFLAVVSAPVCVTGFAVGRVDGQVPAAPATIWWLRAFVLGLGIIGAIVSLPVGLRLLTALADNGPWRVLATGLWFMFVGGIAGYFCGPMFRVLSPRP